MINPQWLELLMSQTIFYGPKDVGAIDLRLYFVTEFTYTVSKFVIYVYNMLCLDNQWTEVHNTLI